jgi:hypothetical protein
MAETTVVSNWHNLLENFQASPKQLYDSVEAAIQTREIPDCKLSRVSISEGGIFSSSREYLRVTRKDFKFDICASPFGKGFFISWWLLYEPSGFFAWLSSFIPVFGTFFRIFIKPITYYQVDTGHMFQETVHSSVIEILDSMTKSQGHRVLTELEKKPIMREFFLK